MVSSFEDLHDATLVQIKFTWETGVINVHLRTASNPDFLLTISNVTTFQATRNFEWGPSEQVNTVMFSEESLSIEMQSGDIIRITGNINFPLKTEVK